MRRLAALIGVIAAALTGCGEIPRDPSATLEQIIERGDLRAGSSPSSVTPAETDLVEGFADSLDVDVVWTEGGESELVAAMERGELDVLIGGLRADSPWTERISLTRAYGSEVVHGEPVERVLAVPRGENALLVTLERYLDGRER
ncbi:MAG: ABC transporter substrate-binding protein [Actinomycetia bacterium]|nr:ABC transporter substrate-binding protein [Actinomycetes bacterium]